MFFAFFQRKTAPSPSRSSRRRTRVKSGVRWGRYAAMAFSSSWGFKPGFCACTVTVPETVPSPSVKETAFIIGAISTSASSLRLVRFWITRESRRKRSFSAFAAPAGTPLSYSKVTSARRRTYYGIRNISDRLCRENGLSVLVPEKGGKGKNYAVYKKEKTAKAKLKLAVDTLIPQVSDFEELLARLQAEGFTIKRGKYVSCLVPGQERFTRLKTLGADYTEEAIRERIEGKRTRTAKAPKTERGVSLLIDIENSIKAAQSRGYEQWAKIHNLKQAAKTMNFITEHKIEQYTDLTAKIAEIQTESEQAADALKSAEKRLADMAVLIKNVSTFQKTKPAYDAYRKARNKDSYRAAHEREIILHEAAAKALKAAGVSKLPNLTALQSEYEKLQEQKEALYADYGRLKKQVKEYDVIKQNIDSILRQPREPEREKGKERGE